MLRVSSLHTPVSHWGEANLDGCTVVCASLGVIFPSSDLDLGGLTRAYGGEVQVSRSGPRRESIKIAVGGRRGCAIS